VDSILAYHIYLTITVAHSYDDDFFYDENYRLTEYDKKLIKMLYNNSIKQGLKQENFIRQIKEAEEK
jgi:hypothetical protein